MFGNFFSLVLLTKCLLFISPGDSVASYDEDLARRLVHFAGAVYCVDDEAFGSAYEDLIFDWECDSCDYIKDTSEIVYVYPFMDSSFWYDTEGMITYDSLNNKITVVFAGTDPTELIDIITDIDLIRVEYPSCAGKYWWSDDCTVHRGFYKSYLTVADDVYDHVLELYNKYSGVEIEVTGHSLGGAIAILCALDLTERGLQPDYVYTFGSPRVGDDEFVDYYKETVGNDRTIRVTHRKDPVPLVPWSSWGWNYLHIPGEVYYPSDSDGSYQICDGSGEDDDCINQHYWWNVLLNVFIISDHLAYLDVDFFSGVLECNTGWDWNGNGAGNLPGNYTGELESTAEPFVNDTYSSIILVNLDWSEYGEITFTADAISSSTGIQMLLRYALKQGAINVRYDVNSDSEIEVTILNTTDISDDGTSSKIELRMEVSFYSEKKLNGFAYDYDYILEEFDSSLKSSLSINSTVVLISDGGSELNVVTDDCDCNDNLESNDNGSDWANVGVVIFLVIFGVLLVASLIFYTKRKLADGRKGSSDRELSSKDQFADKKPDMKKMGSKGFNVQYVHN